MFIWTLPESSCGGEFGIHSQFVAGIPHTTGTAIPKTASELIPKPPKIDWLDLSIDS
jgi:hypothetical protein